MFVRVQGYFPVLPFFLETFLKSTVVYLSYDLIFCSLPVDTAGSSVAWVLLILDRRVGSPSPEDTSSGCYCLSVVMFERQEWDWQGIFPRGCFQALPLAYKQL